MASFFRRAGRAYSRSLETLNAKVAASVVGKVRFTLRQSILKFVLISSSIFILTQI